MQLGMIGLGRMSRGEADHQDRLLSAMRFALGGHLEKPAGQ
jgi:6-phosphogluconate dehydrogenase (decarboxylating)